MKEMKKISKDAKILLLRILKQGYISQQQIEELAKVIDMPTLQVEIIDKREQVEPNQN